jgi:hypothetical protein
MKKIKEVEEVHAHTTRFYPLSRPINDHIKFYLTPTKLACLWCTEGFPHPPIPMCDAFDHQYGVYLVSRQFCSFACACAYARERNGITAISL